MSIVRHDDRPVLARGSRLPTLQHLVDRASGSAAVTVLINVFTRGQAIPEHTHEVEEVLLVTAGECTVTVDGRLQAARAGDAVIIRPGISHAISHNSDGMCKVIAILASPDARSARRSNPECPNRTVGWRTRCTGSHSAGRLKPLSTGS